MVLDAEARGQLEKIIDREISSIPDTVEIGRNLINKKEFLVANPDDFALGMALGTIIATFSNSYSAKYHKMPSAEDLEEINDIFIKRTKEIKDAIFNCG